MSARASVRWQPAFFFEALTECAEEVAQRFIELGQEPEAEVSDEADEAMEAIIAKYTEYTTR